MSLGVNAFGSKNSGFGSSGVMITSESLMGGSNYLSWAMSVELWCKGQGVQDHLTKNASEGDEKAKTLWVKVDAQLCSIMWRSIDSKLMPLFRPFHRCYLVWEKARNLYINDISHFYDVISRMTSLKKQELDMSTYLGQVQVVMEEFETLMSVYASIEKQQEKRQNMFLVLTLAGLPNDLDSVHDQILASPTVPTIDELFSRLLRLAAAPSHPMISSQTLDSSVLVSQSVDNRDETTGNQGFSLSEGEYNVFLQYRASKKTSPQVASVAQTDTSVAGNSFACVSQSSTLGQWVLGSAASDHISGNNSFLSNIAYSQSLPTVTLANGSQTKAKGVGQANPLPSVTLDSILFVPDCPFNLASISHLTRALHCGFMTSQGIVYHTSCPYTPQQNGVAERKNRHIIESPRTLLIESHVPLHFWGDVVLTVCYLVNRMPSSPIQNQILMDIVVNHLIVVVLPIPNFKEYTIALASPSATEILPESTIAPPSPSSTEVLPIPTVEESSVAPPRLPTTGTPLLTYHRCPHPASGPTDSQPAYDPAPTADLSLPSTLIALRKGIRTTLNPNPHYVCLSYHRLLSPYYAFLSSLSFVSIHKSTGEALSHPGWR
ncbi:uncharacterized protein [Nicotiana sylvestris]|uniref:uncharacterized protein n=1 Tax=Nicotiana sylvestris TaxID=4096 RepID=UPI00388C372E